MLLLPHGLDRPPFTDNSCRTMVSWNMVQPLKLCPACGPWRDGSHEGHLFCSLRPAAVVGAHLRDYPQTGTGFLGRRRTSDLCSTSCADAKEGHCQSSTKDIWRDLRHFRNEGGTHGQIFSSHAICLLLKIG